ncbi:MAG: hypothetical protein ACLPND_24440 [Candidatus Korobacteraceae bacterium]
MVAVKTTKGEIMVDCTLRRRLVQILAVVLLVCGAATAADDPSHGATNFVFVPEGRLWHPIGPAKLITTWSGPFRNAGGHPASIYMVFLKEPRSSHELRDSLPSNVRVVHALATDFYYPSLATPGPDLAALGYTASGFDIADKLVKSFPDISALFPSGVRTSGCQASDGNFSFILGKDADAAYLVTSDASGRAINVAYVPAKLVEGDLNAILDGLSYYEQGGMAEIMRFSALFYYLSRVSLTDSLGAIAAYPRCPDTPTVGATGVETPKGWTQAVKALK